jgi:hypothetical protein
VAAAREAELGHSGCRRLICKGRKEDVEEEAKSSAATYALALPPAHGREKKMLPSGAHLSLRGECKYREMYVFVYACSWARVIFIRIPWRI